MSQFNQVQGTPLFMADLQAKQTSSETNNKGLRGRILIPSKSELPNEVNVPE